MFYQSLAVAKSAWCDSRLLHGMHLNFIVLKISISIPVLIIWSFSTHHRFIVMQNVDSCIMFRLYLDSQNNVRIEWNMSFEGFRVSYGHLNMSPSDHWIILWYSYTKKAFKFILLWKGPMFWLNEIKRLISITIIHNHKTTEQTCLYGK